jgi:hypothetical protein
MLYLNSSGDTKVIVTLYENSSNVVNPYFTWRLINKDSNDVIIFTSQDHSIAPWYYNSFTISVATYSSPTASIITIPNGTGQYKYEIYEMANQYDLNLDNAIGLVENGLVTINVTFSSIQSYTASSSTTSVYNNLDRI